MDQAHHKAALMSALALFELLEKYLPSGAERATVACEAYERFMIALEWLRKVKDPAERERLPRWRPPPPSAN
jgi:hypothetical protein